MFYLNKCKCIYNIINYFITVFLYTAQSQVEPTEERIDIELLKGREKIQFYADLMLFEDELHDCGCSTTSVRIVRPCTLHTFSHCVRTLN